MIGRLPESWIAPEHILDLRARVRLRHTLSHQRGEWQQRIQAVLYHHGCPQRRNLMTGEVQHWLAAQPLSTGAREQVTVALAMIEAVDAQLDPLTRELRAYARRQAGCRALMVHFGIGGLVAVTILAELGDARRFSSSRDAVRYGRHARVDGPDRPSGRTACSTGVTHHPSCRRPCRTAGPRTEIRLGARAHTTRTTNRAHAPPVSSSSHPDSARTGA